MSRNISKNNKTSSNLSNSSKTSNNQASNNKANAKASAKGKANRANSGNGMEAKKEVGKVASRKMPVIISAAALVAAIAVFYIFVIAGQGNDANEGAGQGKVSIEPEIPALTINDIRSDPLSFEGEIKITGIHAGTYQPDPAVFFVVDTEELMACRNLGCGAFQLPAINMSDTPMPEVADEIDITGSWGLYEVEGASGTEKVDIFEVTKIDVKRNIMHLLSD